MTRMQYLQIFAIGKKNQSESVCHSQHEGRNQSRILPANKSYPALGESHPEDGIGFLPNYFTNLLL
jgi:hypothetical protein